jgi:tripartite-type tricarboxylate transporter receptor subunit TctC
MIRFKHAIFIILSCFSVLGHSAAFAQSALSDKAIRFVVPYQAGGLPDVLARMVAQSMSESLGQPVIVDNRSGASGIIAATHVSGSDPNGHTLFVGDIGHYAINPALYKDLAYDPNKDFKPVITGVHGPLMLVVNADLPVKTLDEFVALARERPGKVNYGSPGNGSVHQLAMAQFANLAGINLVHVPYRSNAQAIPALLAHDVSAMFVSPPSVNEHVKAGKLRIIAVGAKEPTPLVPGVPTVSEKLFPEFSAVTTVGFFAPAKTPDAVVATLNREIGKALKSPDVMAKMPVMGVDVVADSPDSFAQRIRADQQYYRELVERVGIKID